LLSTQHWAHSFSISAEDIDYITNLLLEKETPLSSKELAIALINSQIEEKRAEVNAQYEGTKVYRPADTYTVGDRLMFSTMDYTTATISSIRDGINRDSTAFRVATVKFDKPKYNLSDRQREFAIDYTDEHPLNDPDIDLHPVNTSDDYTAEDIINDNQITIVQQVDNALTKNPDLVRIAGTWFVRDLMIEIDIGHLHLAEAVLDMNEGGPLTTEQILEEMGGLGDPPKSLQVFSLNYHMNEDQRFDEVGPSGEVQWYLNRLLPRMVQQVPAILQYNPIEYDRNLLQEEMLQLEYDLDDEHSPIKSPSPDEEVSLTLIYPHRRIGTLPINSETQYIFPEAKTPRIAITIIDVIDGEEYPCWIVHENKYVYGLASLYQKHHLPVGAYVHLNNTDDPSRIEIEFDSYRPRTEWIPLVNGTDGDQLHFETAKRAIGADYDDMIIVGVNNLQEVDSLGNDIQNRQVPLAKLLRNLITELSKHNPQKTVHAKVLYSTLNILRRCPPGPIFATLIANPDFENVGGHYWKLSD
jgi:hypothetical protein